MIRKDLFGFNWLIWGLLLIVLMSYSTFAAGEASIYPEDDIYGIEPGLGNFKKDVEENRKKAEKNRKKKEKWKKESDKKTESITNDLVPVLKNESFYKSKDQSDDVARAALCSRLEYRFGSRRADLKALIMSQKRELAAWWTGQKAESESGGIGSNLFPNNFTYPPRVGADVNQNIGALECLDLLADMCTGRTTPRALDPENAQDVASFNTYVTGLSNQIKNRADTSWAQAQERKELFAANRAELRWAAEANRFSGLTTECRGVVTALHGMSLPAPTANPTVDLPTPEETKKHIEVEPSTKKTYKGHAELVPILAAGPTLTEIRQVTKHDDTVIVPQDEGVETREGNEDQEITGEGQDGSTKSTPSCSYKYTKWGKCSRETKEQTRKVIAKEPVGCVEDSKLKLTQGCCWRNLWWYFQLL